MLEREKIKSPFLFFSLPSLPPSSSFLFLFLLLLLLLSLFLNWRREYTTMKRNEFLSCLEFL